MPASLVVKKGSKMRARVAGVHARAGVAHREHDPAADGHALFLRLGGVGDVHVLGGDGEHAARRHGVARVDGEVDHDLLDLAGVGVHRAEAIGERGAQLDVLADEAAQHHRQVVHERVQIERARLQDLLAREGQQLRRQRGRAQGGAMDLIGVAAVRRVALEHGEQDLRVAAHRGEDVVEVVRHAAGEAADRLHALRVLQLRLEPLVLGDVVREGDDAGAPVALDELERVDGVEGAPVARAHAHLELAGEARGDGVAEARELGRVERDADLVEGLADDLLALEPEDAQVAVADVDEMVVLEVDDADDDGAVVKHRREQVLLLAQLGLGAAPLGQVADDADEEALAVEIDAARADLAGELAAVAADVHGLELHAVGDGARHLIADLVVRARGADIADVPPGQLLERIAVRGQRGAVGIANVTAGVHEQDDVAGFFGDGTDAANHETFSPAHFIHEGGVAFYRIWASVHTGVAVIFHSCAWSGLFVAARATHVLGRSPPCDRTSSWLWQRSRS